MTIKKTIDNTRHTWNTQLNCTVFGCCVSVHVQVKDPSLCVNDGCVNKAVFEKDRGPQYCSNECVVMDTRYVNLDVIQSPMLITIFIMISPEMSLRHGYEIEKSESKV